MIDYKTLHPSVQKAIEDNLKATTEGMANAGTARFRELCDRACDLFEHYAIPDQVLTCAFILGMVWATMEGSTTTFEQDNSMLMTMQDRRAMFDALCETVWREALEAATHPDCPQPKTRTM